MISSRVWLSIGLHLYLKLKRDLKVAGVGECSATVLVVDDHGMGGDLRRSTASEHRDYGKWIPADCLRAHCAARVLILVAAAAPHAPALSACGSSVSPCSCSVFVL